MRDNNIPLTTQQYVYEHRKDNPDQRIKEIYEIDLADYSGLSKSEAIQKFLIDS
jgi:cytidylate kinase